MSWDMRRLAMAIENAALCLAAAVLVINGYWIIATVAVVLKFIDNVIFSRDWENHGASRTTKFDKDR